jgi:enolase-phosphatase E1
MAIRAVLVDIEGTTTDLRFVHDTLFPLARRELPRYVAEHASSAEVRAARAAIAAPDARSPESVPLAEVIRTLLAWIDEDRKETSLKALQGKIWREAYAVGALKSHVYPDVEPAFQRWTAAGLRVHVFSSGSVEAQRLLFAHTEASDLTRYIDEYFDTTTGPKRDPESYRLIAGRVSCAPEEVLFLSDITAELDAAAEAGMKTVQLLRPGAARDAASRHEFAESFDAIAP